VLLLLLLLWLLLLLLFCSVRLFLSKKARRGKPTQLPVIIAVATMADSKFKHCCVVVVK
jgi:hypothetical protein